MLLKKIKSSSISEMLIALVVIAICFGVASLVFIRTTKTTTKFLEIKQQTELQSEILQKIFTDSISNLDQTSLDIEVESTMNEQNQKVVDYMSSDEKIVWRGLSND